MPQDRSRVHNWRPLATYATSIGGVNRRVIGPMRVVPSGLPHYLTVDTHYREWIPAAHLEYLTATDGDDHLDITAVVRNSPRAWC